MVETIFQKVLLTVLGAGAGFCVSGGVFTTMIAIGLVPRFAGKTHTAKHIFLYEEMAVCGTLIGGLATIFNPVLGIGERFPGILFLMVFGFFAGIFVGCLALAIAEMLDSIPIFARRSRFRHGMGVAVLSMALGKAVGSILYFIYGIFMYGGVA